MKFKDKVVLITGASSGIGKSFALKVAKDNAKIILVSRSQDRLEEVKKEIEKLGSEAYVFATDVSVQENVRKVFEYIYENFKKLDGVFNNAGIGFVGEIWEIKDEEILNTININVVGMITVTKYAAEIMKQQNNGHIVMTSSVAGLVTLPQWSVYVASKWAITGFADCIRTELEKYNINVTTIHPAGIKTNFFDKQKTNIDESKMGKLLDPDYVTEIIYNSFFTKSRQVIIPNSFKLFVTIKKLFPSVYDFLIKKQIKNINFKNSN